MSDAVRTTWTLDYLGWKPWVPRSVDTDLSPELHERAAAAVGSRGNSDYIAVLTNDYPAWKARDVGRAASGSGRRAPRRPASAAESPPS